MHLALHLIQVRLTQVRLTQALRTMFQAWLISDIILLLILLHLHPEECLPDRCITVIIHHTHRHHILTHITILLIILELLPMVDNLDNPCILHHHMGIRYSMHALLTVKILT